jgi:hypothetical protein
LPAIKVLKFDRNHLTCKGLSDLFNLQNLKTLKVLSVRENKLRKYTDIQGPYNNIELDSSRELVMNLDFLDISDNNFVNIETIMKNSSLTTHFRNANRFLQNTVILCENTRKMPQDLEQVLPDFHVP